MYLFEKYVYEYEYQSFIITESCRGSHCFCRSGLTFDSSCSCSREWGGWRAYCRPVVAIAGAVLLLHVEPQALHGVGVQDVGELCVVMVLTVGPAVRPVHHDGVAPSVSPPTTLSRPELRSRGGPNIWQPLGQLKILFTFSTYLVLVTKIGV